MFTEYEKATIFNYHCLQTRLSDSLVFKLMTWIELGKRVEKTILLETTKIKRRGIGTPDKQN